MSFLSLTAPSSALSKAASEAFDTGYQTTAEQLGKQASERAALAKNQQSEDAETARNDASLAQKTAAADATRQQTLRLAQGKGLAGALDAQDDVFKNVIANPDKYGASGVALAQKGLFSDAINRANIAAQEASGADLGYSDPDAFNIVGQGIQPSSDYQTRMENETTASQFKVPIAQQTLSNLRSTGTLDQQKASGTYQPSPKFLSTKTKASPVDQFHSALSALTAYPPPDEDGKAVEGYYTARAKMRSLYPAVINSVISGADGSKSSAAYALAQIQSNLGLDQSGLSSPDNWGRIRDQAKTWLDTYGGTQYPEQTQAYQSLYDTLGGGIMGGGK
ncbi:hypothetical protein KGP36_01665 [Patescibacteria group bacterium]|nr:hypothetical protein [Patescibacteria group bacterium]